MEFLLNQIANGYQMCGKLFYHFKLKLSIRLRTMKLIWFKIKNFFLIFRIGPFQSRSDFLFTLHQHLSRHSDGNGDEVDERLFHSEVVQVKGSQHSRLLCSGFEQRQQDRSQDSSVLVQRWWVWLWKPFHSQRSHRLWADQKAGESHGSQSDLEKRVSTLSDHKLRSRRAVRKAHGLIR